jgi:glycosyltransferase involved in cell wall biosynthesis
MKKAVVTVTNDLVTDQRVMRTIEVMRQMGFEPTFVGRKLTNSLALNKPYPTHRFDLWFNTGFLFYANYNLRLFFFLLFRRYDLYLSNDLDTLLPNFLVATIRRKALIYDSHEYFTGVPEIQHRPIVKAVWTTLERWIFPRLKNVITVNDSIADLYKNQYGKPVKVVRNISDSSLPAPVKSRIELGLPQDAFILINQGAGINVDRGMEEALLALKELPNDVILLIVGNGDAVPGLKTMCQELNLIDRVIFKPRQPYLEMLQFTINADCGLSLDKPLSPNYKYSLPNKVFDYIKCGLPLVVSDVVEVQKVVDKYKIGEVIVDHKPQSIAKAVLQVRAYGKRHYTHALQKASAENNWEKEQGVWRDVFAKFM